MPDHEMVSLPNHFDFIRTLGLNLHALSCEAALLSDNVVRMGGVSVPDSLLIAQQLLETLQCGL